jgi:serine/threonine-protein kinase
MAGNPQVLGLLEEMLDSGRTPEEVCRDCPELLPEVRRRWEDFCHIDAAVGALLPGLRTRRDGDAAAPTPPAADLPQVPGYEVEAVLGRGGMGVVYRARHLALKRTVALKMLAGGHSNPSEQARFRAEAEAVARLQHPNVVQIYEIGDAGGLPFIALEFVEGGSLAERLAGRPLPPRDAARLVAALATGMHLAHSRNLVHRDLKPGNVLLDGSAGAPVGQCRPKVTDFGLARQMDADSGRTRIGVVMGTPNYMAPEQAEGRAHAAGPAADVYALGAILYECLTGRPPFQGATPLETLEQVRTREPAAPSSLNRQVPRDLETICLKCLRKEPERRYSSARELADDLGRFVRGEPVAARPVGVAERMRKWVWRRPTAAGLLAAVVLLAAVGLWLVQQRAQRRADLYTEVGMALAQAERLRKGFHFHEARELLTEARQRLEAGPDDLRQQVDRSRADLDLVERLDTARFQATTLVEGKFDEAGAESLYASAFADAGLGGEGDNSEAVAAAVRESAVDAQIVAALDDWASITQDPARRAWLLAVARRADPDPARNRLRQAELWQDGARLTRLAQELNVPDLSPQLAAALGRVARENRAEAVALLTAAQARFPQDFWITFELGFALYQAQRWDEALGYCRAALALRPEASTVHNALGEVLRRLGRVDEGVAHLRQALRLDPKNVWAHNNLGTALRNQGRLDEAIDHYQQALRIDPKSAATHNNLAFALHARGRVDEAIDHFRESIRLDPSSSAMAHNNLGGILRDRGQYEEAIDHLRQAVQIEPKLVTTQNHLGITMYEAARAAVRAAASQGPENVPGGEPGRAGLRRKALDWLRADLELTIRLQGQGTLPGWSLAAWQTEPALTSVRDPAALAKLPAAEREQWQRLWADVAALRAADPVEQGRARAARRDWTSAAESYARALTRGPTEAGHYWFEYAALLLLSGDRLGYARACAHMVERCGKEPGPRAYHVARACTLAPNAVTELSLPGRLAETELQRFAREFWSLTEQGALAYRAGRFQEAVAYFDQSLRADPAPGKTVLNWLWLALANQRLGQSEEARRWLDKATAWLDQYHDGMPDRAEEELGLHLHNWLEAHVLRREAETLIRPADPR